MNFIEYYDESSFKTNFISNLNKYFDNCQRNSLYQYDNFNTKRRYLNFLNQFENNLFDRTSKKIIEKELIRLENLSSGLGDLFLSKIIEYNDGHKLDKILNMWDESVQNFELSHVEEFIEKNLQNEESKELCNYILKHSPAGSAYFVENSNMKDNTLRISQKVMFNLKYDTEMLCGKNWNRNEANILLIDGYIDSLGEIHHLLQLASENKNPYLIICKGLRDDVKCTVMHNVMRGTIDVLIVSLETNEENVNILNDISSCTNSDIISALKGDTISTSVKKELKIIKGVHVRESGLSFKLSEENSLKVQRQFLINKKNSLNKSDPNFKYLNQRIKNLSSKRVDFYLRNNACKEFKVEIDYFLKFLINGTSGIIRNTKDNKLYTLKDVYIFTNIFKSTINTLDNIGCCLLKEELL